jgi:hypothetical protein
MTDAAFDDLDMAAARAKFSAKVDGRKGARKTRQKKTAEAVDGRSLRATGRTEHLNFKATPQIKQALAKHVPKGKTSLWLEEAIIEKFKREGIDIDA